MRKTMKSQKTQGKKILKELLDANPDYSGRWDMDFEMDLQTKNHIQLVRLCQLLGFEDLYDDKKRQEYVQKMKSKEKSWKNSGE